MNYTELTEAIKEYCENEGTEFIAQIPTFVRQTEERLLRAVYIPELRKNATTTTTTGDQYVGRPSDFLSVFSFAVEDASGDYQYLYDKDTNFIREAYPSSSTQGVPKYYAQFDGDSTTDSGHFILGPTPDAAYTVELHYYYDPPSIVSTSTSWLGDNAESALLYGCLVEGYTFMKGEADVLSHYMQQFDDAVLLFASVGKRSIRDEYRDGHFNRES